MELTGLKAGGAWTIWAIYKIKIQEHWSILLWKHGLLNVKDDFDNKDNKEGSLDGNFMNIWILNRPPTTTNGLSAKWFKQSQFARFFILYVSYIRSMGMNYLMKSSYLFEV